MNIGADIHPMFNGMTSASFLRFAGHHNVMLRVTRASDEIAMIVYAFCQRFDITEVFALGSDQGER